MLARPALSAVLQETALDRLSDDKAYDAVVIGAGATGATAALHLADAGARVLLLDAGAVISPLGALSRRLARGALRRLLSQGASDTFLARRQPIQSQCYAWHSDPDVFVDDVDCPYGLPEQQPFLWFRARGLGGRMSVRQHGRQYYRLGPGDLHPEDGLSPAWPLRPGELDPWYTPVERRLGLAGSNDGLPWLPDSDIGRVLSPTRSEAALQKAIRARWPGVQPVLGRFAPFDLLESAAATGRLLVRTQALACGFDVDRSGHVAGVNWIDARTRRPRHSPARLVFACASALESTRLLLLSRNAQGRLGLGAASGALGHFLMDHIRVRASGYGPPLPPEPAAEFDRCLYLARFDARDAPSPPPGRGFGVQVYVRPQSKGASHFSATAFGEMLPRADNRVVLDPERRDRWGIPILRIECRHSVDDRARGEAEIAALRELADAAGVRLQAVDRAPAPPGSANHECGTARMGDDAGNSVLDPFNQCWEARGLYVTDGACMPSQGFQNPTLTLMALTARACDHALRGA